VKIRSEVSNGFIEINEWTLDYEWIMPYFDCEIVLNAEGFAGRAKVYLDAADLRAFVSDLEELDRTRRGKATLGSMSPTEFQLIFEALDRLGHILVAAHVKETGSTTDAGNRYDLMTSVCFGIDPTSLPTIIKEFKARLNRAD
jgi:hypothetical protein